MRGLRVLLLVFSIYGENPASSVDDYPPPSRE
jgi:hypothetical protein